MCDRPQIEKVEAGLLVRAPAKINLSLLIAGKRPDGFHEIETIMAKVSLFDEILIQRGARPGIELQCKGPHWAPQGPENLVYRAAEALFDKAAVNSDIKITLTKNIPAGSGLGSASSDAAATIIGLNTFLSLNLDAETLARAADTLGSDVTFFVYGPLAICTGRGEKVSPLEQTYELEALVVLPDVNVSTKEVYENYTHLPEVYRNLHSRIDGLIRTGDLDAIVGMRANMLAKTCYSLSPQLAELKKEIEALGIGPLCLSGSGSAMFCVISRRGRKHAGELQRTICDHTGCNTAIVKNVPW
mgnify:CR=1 FL=1